MFESLLEFDSALYMSINSGMSSGFLDMILVPLRHKLFWIPLYLFLITFIMMNFSSRKWLILVLLFANIGVSDLVSSKFIKKSVKRARPCHIVELSPVKRVPCTNGFSFTSSHATNHFALGTYLFLLFGFSRWRAMFLGWAAIISFAQVYVGVHYPIDVIVGALIGILIGSSIFVLYNFIRKQLKIE